MSRLYEWFFHRESADFPKTVLTTQTGSYSLHDIQKEVEIYTSLLKQTGEIRGRRIALIVPVVSSFLSLMLAANRLGAAVVPISPFLRSNDLTKILEFINPHIVFTIKQYNNFNFFEAVAQWAHSAGGETIIYESDDCSAWNRTVIEGATKYVENKPIDIIACTSGSTGMPKGVMVDLEFIQFGDQSLSTAMAFSKGDRLFGMVPVSGLFGLCLLLSAIKRGLHFVATESFSFPDMIQMLKENPVNKLITSPSLFRALYLLTKRDENLFYQSLTLVGLGGENISPDFIEAVKPIKNCKLIGMYGLTELGCIMFSKHDIREGIEWALIPGVEIHIANASSSEGIGELAVKTPNGFSGYYQRPDLTEEVYKNGWFYTGDLARVTSDAKMEIVGRKKDMIKKGGQQVIPGEIEKLLAGHPSVEKAVVVGVPHSIFGEQIVAFVVGKERIDKMDLYSFCQGKVARYKVPDHIFILDEIPVSQGKVDKVTLRQWAAEKIAGTSNR
jgi:long-chain acyl-CoA synthetase